MDGKSNKRNGLLTNRKELKSSLLVPVGDTHEISKAICPYFYFTVQKDLLRNDHEKGIMKEILKCEH